MRGVRVCVCVQARTCAALLAMSSSVTALWPANTWLSVWPLYAVTTSTATRLNTMP